MGKNGIGAHLDWLRGGEVRLASGAVKSWVGEGWYPYDESLCYLIKLLDYCAALSGDHRYLQEIEPSLERLGRVIETRGGIGREGQIYLFDTGICLAALCAHARTTGGDLSALLAPLADTLVRMVAENRAVLSPGGPPSEDRWSRRFGPHLIKMVIPLVEAADLLGRPDLRATAGELLERLVQSTCRQGVFYTEPDLSRTYLHGHCYAVEGLLYAAARGLCSGGDALDECARRLAAIQRPGGGMPGWWPDEEDAPEVADTTAQAIRIWQCVDRRRFSAQIRRGIEFLKALAGERGGIRYRPGSRHLNTWSTVFATEALLWDRLDPDPLWII